MHRIKFDKKFNKIFFNEKIFLGERIRDLKYHDEIDAILLALEDKGELGILSNYDVPNMNNSHIFHFKKLLKKETEISLNLSHHLL